MTTLKQTCFSASSVDNAENYLKNIDFYDKKGNVKPEIRQYITGNSRLSEEFWDNPIKIIEACLLSVSFWLKYTDKNHYEPLFPLNMDTVEEFKVRANENGCLNILIVTNSFFYKKDKQRNEQEIQLIWQAFKDISLNQQALLKHNYAWDGDVRILIKSPSENVFLSLDN